jgi:hypothetical protein
MAIVIFKGKVVFLLLCLLSELNAPSLNHSLLEYILGASLGPPDG